MTEQKLVLFMPLTPLPRLSPASQHSQPLEASCSAGPLRHIDSLTVFLDQRGWALKNEVCLAATDNGDKKPPERHGGADQGEQYYHG